MKATHKRRDGLYSNRVFHLVPGTDEAYVKIGEGPWQRSAWSGNLEAFNKAMTKLSTFKGNK